MTDEKQTESKTVHEPHKLIHLEEGFLAEWGRHFTGMQPTAKKLLAWIAEKIEA